MALPVKVPLAGYRFGSLLVLKPSSRKHAKHRSYECLCDCGRKVVVRALDLRTGAVMSCGCKRGRHGTTLKATPSVPVAQAGRRGADRISTKRA